MFQKKIFSISKNKKGSVTVELAIFVTLIAGLIFGYMKVQDAIRLDMALQVAAREAAREYATTHNAERAKAKARMELASLADINSIQIKPVVDGNARGMIISKRYDFNIPMFGDYDITLKGISYFHKDTL